MSSFPRVSQGIFMNGSGNFNNSGNININSGASGDSLLSDLCLSDPRLDKARIQDTNGQLLRDSYCWILENEEWRKWYLDPQSRLLWIRGDPGKGKTMLLCGLIDELEKRETIQAPCHAYFFCQATNDHLRSASAVLRGLLFMLVTRYPRLEGHISEQDKRLGSRLFEGTNAWYALAEMAKAIFQDDVLKGVTLLVDALDECLDGRQQLLSFIVRETSSLPVRWIVSSRNWPEIDEQMKSAVQKSTLHLELNESSIADAVRHYISFKVGQLAQAKGYDEKTRAAVAEHLTTKADNTFLWVALVYKELADPRVGSWETNDILQALPPGLEELYERMMNQICQNGRNAQRWKDILATMAVVYRPVTVQELAVIVTSLNGLSMFDLQRLIESCGSFLTLRQGAVYFVHQSAKDFVLKTSVGGVFLNGTNHQHDAIFQASLRQLLQSDALRRDIYGLEDPGILIDDIIVPDPDPLGPLVYACEHWVDHLGAAEFSDSQSQEHLADGGTVHCFLQRKYLYWLEAMSLKDRPHLTLKAIHNLVAIAERPELPTAVGKGKLAAWVKDAQQFLEFHMDTIFDSPLQLYWSAMVFSPDNSVVKASFQQCVLADIQHSTQEDWAPSPRILHGHTAKITVASFAVDGRRLYTGSCDATVKVWDVTTGSCLKTLVGHDEVIRVLEAYMDAIVVGSGTKDGIFNVKIWEVARFECVRTIHLQRPALCLARSPNGLSLAAGFHGFIEVWDAIRGMCIQQIQHIAADNPRKMGFSADSKRLVVTNANVREPFGWKQFTLLLLDLSTGECLHTVESSGVCISYSPSNRRLAVSIPSHYGGPESGLVEIRNLDTLELVQSLGTRPINPFRFLSLSEDDSFLACGEGFQLTGWNLATGTMCLKYKAVYCLAYSHASRHSVHSKLDDEMTIELVDLSAAVEAGLSTFPRHNTIAGHPACSTDGNLLALCMGSEQSGDVVASPNDRWEIWDVATRTRILVLPFFETFNLSGRRCQRAAFSPDDSLLAVTGHTGAVAIFVLATGRLLWALPDVRDEASAIVFTNDGTCLVTGYADGRILIRDTSTGGCLRVLSCHGAAIKSVVASADPETVASVNDQDTIHVWNVCSGVSAFVFQSPIDLRLERQNWEDIYNPAHLFFEMGSSTRLWRGRDRYVLEEKSKIPTHTRAADHHGYTLATVDDGQWIIHNGKGLLRLPSSYGKCRWFVFGSIVVLNVDGFRGRDIIFIRFPTNKPDNCGFNLTMEGEGLVW